MTPIPISILRTKEQRQSEVRPIILKLKELKLSPITNNEIKQLFENMKTYINDGSRIEIDIPCIDLNVRFKGVLAINLNERCWVKIECLVKQEEE
jgi:hypothetical protein